MIRGRDCIVQMKDWSLPVAVASGFNSWTGGVGVQWTGTNTGNSRFEVTLGVGQASGILVNGNIEAGDQFTSITDTAGTYRIATLFGGGFVVSTRSFEKYTLASRLVNSQVPLVYVPDTPLYISLRGLWTIEDELTIIGAANAPCQQTGWVTQAPGPGFQDYLGVRGIL